MIGRFGAVGRGESQVGRVVSAGSGVRDRRLGVRGGCWRGRRDPRSGGQRDPIRLVVVVRTRPG